MPSPLTSSFASAAAGSNGESAGDRRGNTNDWPSKNRPNGATQTFRRTSTNTASTRESSQTASGTSTSGPYIPPHLNANYQGRNGASSDSRYSKDQLLDIYQRLHSTKTLNQGLDELFDGPWDPVTAKNGTSNTWNGRGDIKDSSAGPEVCWDYDAGSRPFGLSELTEEEKQLFTSSINSPLKLPTSASKDGAASGSIGGRKTSLSSHQVPGQRRRDASDSFSANGPLSPTGSKPFFRDEPSANAPPPALLRRRTDYKEDVVQSSSENTREDIADSEGAFGPLKRSTTGPLSAGLSGPSGSPWSSGAQGSAFESMGSFGSFAVGTSNSNQDSMERRPGFGSGRGSSRFKDLLSKGSAEDISPSMKEKASLGNLEKLPEEDFEGGQSRLTEIFKTRPNRSETNPYQDMNTGARGGSAALGGARELSSPSQGVEQMGFSFGMPGNIGARDFVQKDSQQEVYHQTPHSRNQGREQMSPTNTNPYQSPHGDRGDTDDNDANDSESQPSGLPPFGSIRRNIGSGMEDRPSSRGLQGLGALGGLPPFGGSSAWGTSGTPGRERPTVTSAFGDPIFSPMADLQSPGLAGMGGNNFFGSQKGRPSKLGPMFPPAMQEQMRDRPEGSFESFDARGDDFQNMGPRDPFDGGRRREDSSYRGSAFMEDSRSLEEASKPFSSQSAFPQASGGVQVQTPITSGPANTTSGHGLSQSSESSGSNQLPTAQQKTMVMPDRMRWVYRDPQGKMQGPWSGLEMHDWFKAGFFTAELQVKKLEDSEYEPLAQLVRRIGNSREPFLVPQIGVPHGPPPAAAAQGNHWASPTIPGAGTPQVGSAQPPFASSFPSFGTTLTAEQQNALERRKQEEQFLMARQKEHLAQQQVLMKQALSMQNGPLGMHSLQHHSSAHSLQSQPSFGSITSPSGYQPSPMQGPIQPPQSVPSFFEGGVRQQPPTSNMGVGRIGDPRGGRDEELLAHMDRISLGQRSSQPFGQYEGQPQGNDQIASILQERARLHMEQQQADMRNHQGAFLGQSGRNDRLQEFQSLQGDADDDRLDMRSDAAATLPIGAPQRRQELQYEGHLQETQPRSDDSILSLSQQVKNTTSNQQMQPESASAWGKVEKIAQAPPPLSISPLPAPAAQRNRQHVADALAAESRSQSQTPVETSSSVAPWAEKSAEVAKGPSLKEIQEAEARRAAQQEEIVVAARRAQLEQERLTQVLPPAPGLPSSATWGNTASPATPTAPAASAWGKSTQGKGTANLTNGSTKKTLAQIQKEEESRKQRAAAAAAASAQAANALSTPAGKRYAELASKIGPGAGAVPNSAWTTVGSSGKAKAPATVIATPQAVTRAVSGTTAAVRPRPTLQSIRSSTMANQAKATDEFTKWAKSTLGKGLNSNINVDDFVQTLLLLPPETDILSESVYANSPTLDGRRFAEEFIRRRKNADKGIIDSTTSGTPPNAGIDSKTGGGWSEVAKKGPAAAPKEENNAAFKVVPTKKKGKR